MNNNIKRFLKTFVNPLKFSIIISGIFGLFYGFFNAISYWVFASLVNVLFNNQEKLIQSKLVDTTNFNNWLKSLVYNNLYSNDKFVMLYKFAILVLVIFILKDLFRYLTDWNMRKVVIRVATNLRGAIYKHIIKQPPKFLDKYNSGSLFSYFNNDVNAIISGLKALSLDLIVNIVSIITIFAVLLSISVKWTIISLIIIPVSGVLIGFVSTSIRRRSTKRLKMTSDVNDGFYELLKGFSVIKSFVLEKILQKRFNSKLENFYKLQLREDRMLILSSPLNEVLSIMVGVGIFIFAGREVFINQTISQEDFIRFFSLLFGLVQPIKALGKLYNNTNVSFAALNRVYDILDSSYTIKSGNKPFSFNKTIEIKSLYFKYFEDSKDYILKDINLSIKKGEKVAFVGPSGSGKSTINKLLLRFYDFNEGEIVIDNSSIKEFDIKEIRKNISYVDQDIFLFHDTIKNNITIFDTQEYDETILEKSGIDFLDEKENHIDTNVGEDGSQLSGGQKQRVTIARALTKNSPIIIFDEATSALDSKTEQIIQRVIFEELKDKTIFIVAHRLSTITRCDKIVLLNNGMIEDVGSHEELLQKNSLYRELNILQK